jgi:GNAT superfamily N-acetyltransferase
MQRAVAELPVQPARLADDREVLIRGAGSADLAGIIDFFERLSTAARYFRFLSPQPRMRRAMVEQIVAPGPDRVTVLAQPVEFRDTARHVVAVGGWAYVAREDRCDISIAVADAWQNVGLGTYVMLVLLQAAVACGQTRFAAEVLSSNMRMLGLLRELGAPMRSRQEAGVVRVEFELPPMPRMTP